MRNLLYIVVPFHIDQLFKKYTIMKTFQLVLAALLATVIGFTACAQNQPSATKTETIAVAGSCGMCKTRIEKAASIDGVTKAVWDSRSQSLTLVYDPAKLTTDEVKKRLAAAGHDTDTFKADSATYSQLPGC
jgi:copper chaperone CopZ